MQYNEGENSSHFKKFLNKRWVKVVLIIDVLIVLAIIGVLIWNATKTATVNFSIAPIDAKITLNGQGDYKNGTYKLHPGNYEVTVSRDGLESKTFDLELKSGYVTTLAAFLTGENNNFEFYELKDNYASFQKLSEIASAGNNQTTDQDTSAEGFIADLKNRQSISKVLPIKDYIYAEPEINAPTAGFAIRYGEEGCERTACLLVSYFGDGYEESVAQAIKDAGYNPTGYQILYERYSN
jgi:hypothetical protein